MDHPRSNHTESLVGDKATQALRQVLVGAGIGGRLPSERLLSLQLGVSRTLLRDRLGVLEALGILERRVGVGTYVRRLDPTRLGEALEMGMQLEHLPLESLHDIHVALEREAVSQAAIHQNHICLAGMRVALDNMRASSDMFEFDKADDDFHTSLLNSAESPSLTYFYHALSRPLERTIANINTRRDRLRDRADLLYELHADLYAAIRTADPKLARDAYDSMWSQFNRALTE